MTSMPPPAGSPYRQGPPVPGHGTPYPGGPPYTGPPGPPYPAPPPPSRTSVLEILALVLAIVVPPLGLVLGVVALVRVRGRGRSGTGLAVAGIVVGGVLTSLLAVGVVRGIALSGPAVGDVDLEREIATATGQQGVPLGAVDCPDSAEPRAGVTFTCTAVVDGQTLRFAVTQTDDTGNVTYRRSGWAFTVKAEELLVTAAAKNFPATKWAATCADGRRVLVGGPGTTFPCTLTVAGDPGRTEQHTVTITNETGDLLVE